MKSRRPAWTDNTEKEQLELWDIKLKSKMFSIERMLLAKLNRLSENIDQLSHSDVVWLSRIEDFFMKNEYITEKQTRVLDAIIENNSKKLTLKFNN